MLTEDQLDKFKERGFLVIENVLNDSDLLPLESEYCELLDRHVLQYHQDGRIPSLFEELSFGERFSQVVAICPECIDFLNISLPLVNGRVDPDKYHSHAGPGIFSVLRNSKILDIVESVLGPEISSSPVQQMRIKPPQKKLLEQSITHSGVGLTTWHQDTVAVLPEANDTNQLTVWVAVTDANEENGCLVSIPCSHLEGAHPHTPGAIPREPSIPDEIIGGREGVSLPVNRGGVIIFHKQNIHRSLPNRSDHFRWSIDIRYHPTGQPNGRPAFPGFIARSKSSPESELTDPEKWVQLWDDARNRIIEGKVNGPIFKDWTNSVV